MKQLIIIVSLVLFSFYPLKDNQKEQPYLAGTDNPLILNCPEYLPTERNINANPNFAKPDAGLNNIEQNWYSAAVENIMKEEYNITYSEELKSYQSPNSANNIRFTYQNNGFTAKTMQTKIPLFDVNDKMIREEDKKYKKTEDWSVEVKVESEKLKVESGELHVSSNTAWTEYNNLKIDYKNTAEGMRQDFIIKEKPSGDDDLQLIMNVRTNLKMSVSKDRVAFRSSKDGSDKMHYSSLKAWDANGKILNAYFDKQNDRQFAIRIIDKDAQYPVTVDPLSSTPDWTVTCDQWSRYGDGVSAGDINGDGYDDVTISAPAYEPGGAVFIYYGSANGPSSSAGRILYGAGIGFGNRINCKGDINNDNYCDLIVGDPFNEGGKVWMYYGSQNGVSDSAKSQLHSVSGGTNFGYSVSSADVNGDGFSDAIIGCQTESDNRQIGAFVYLGSSSGINDLPAWTASVTSGTNYEGFYFSLSGAGDINNDGYEDIITGTWSGYAMIYLGDANKGMYEPADIILSQPYDYFGQSVSSAGDINFDGFDDVAAGSRTTAVFLYYGSQNGLNSNFSILNSGAYNLSSAGDFNHDGFGDLITTGLGEGIYLYFGSASGIGTNPYFFNNSAINISTGDINGDGTSDIIGAIEFNGFAYYGSSSYTPPEITNLSPTQNAISVNKSSDIEVTFNQDMNALSINNSNIKIYASYSGFLNCTISYDAVQKKVIINPFNDFKTGEDISVTLTSGIESSAGAALKTFVYQFTAAATGGTGIFTEASLINPNGTHPSGIAVADINSDGNVDLMIGRDNIIKFYKNIGEAHFTEFSMIIENGYFRTGDIDNDGDIDILLNSNGNLKTYSNDGTGLFALSNTTSGSAGEMADLDGDGDLDIAFGSVSIEKNINGIFYPDSSLGITPCYGLSAFISPLSVTDFNNDGRLDISVYEYGLYCDILEFCSGCGSLHVFKNSPQNNFSEHVIHSANLFEGYSIFEKNLLLSFNKDNDSDADFITPHFNLSNLGNGTFADNGPLRFWYYALKGDFDGDGDIDIFSSYDWYTTVYKNDSQGNFSEIVNNNYWIYAPPDPVTADFDNDGSLDIAAVKYNSNGVSVLLNDYNCAHPQFSISGSPVILVGSADNVFVSSAVNGNWELTNYGSTQASIPANSTGDTVLVSAGNNPGQFTLNHTAYYECGGDTLLSATIYVDHALPVKLAEFTSVINGRNVTLNWSTAEELNNSGFDIERRDARRETLDEWSKIGFINGSGTISEPKNYSFTDKNLTSGKYKYRLKQIDFNGNFEYFELAEEVSIGIPDKFYLSQNYPNPFNPVTNLEYGIPKLGFVSLKVYDVLGRELITLVNEIKEPGYYKIKFDAGNLSSGVYFYRMTSNEYVAVKKFVVMK